MKLRCAAVGKGFLAALGLKREKGQFVGVYNGRKITGVVIKAKIFFDTWQWMPRYIEYPKAVAWGCFWVGFGWDYD
jgi:hypothetical protein